MSRLLRIPLTVLFLAASPSPFAVEAVDGAAIDDGEATFLGINHIGLSVRDLDAMLAFYREATGFELIRRESIGPSPEVDRLFGQADLRYEVAVLRAPNMLLELREFDRHRAVPAFLMPPQGPGMTHTCFQSRSDVPGWPRFMAAGATALTRGGEPVDLGGYGVTYGYAYDPEGNMMELEQLDGAVLEASGYDVSWNSIEESLWMSQVALVTPDLDRLMDWYAALLTFPPYRVAELRDNARADAIAGTDGLDIRGGWFRVSKSSKVLEMWEYRNPRTQSPSGARDATAPGYSFSFEVADIDAEYERLRALGVEFVGAPQNHRGFRQVYAFDIDGNVFALREALDPASPLSVRQLEER